MINKNTIDINPVYFIESSLEDIKNHNDITGIHRYEIKNAPIDIAFHKIDVDTVIPKYTKNHKHDVEHELNIIINEENLEYEININDKVYIVKESSTFFIPAGIYHSANVIKGKGIFICLKYAK